MQYAEGRVSVDGRELRYLEAGEGEPLVWLHGGFGLHPTRRHRPAHAELPGRRPSSCPGFGSSSATGPARTFDELSEQVADGIEALGLSRYLLHGTSFGGATALHLALNHPDRRDAG